MKNQTEAVIFCPGPSLVDGYKSYHPSKRGLSIGVTRAVAVIPWRLDWWSMGDAPLLVELLGRGLRPVMGCISPRAVIPSAEGFGIDLIAWEDLPGHGIHWCRKRTAEGFSLTAALSFCVMMYADDVDVVGHDQTEAPDAAGYNGPEANRTPERWQRQQAETNSFLGAFPLRVNYRRPA